MENFSNGNAFLQLNKKINFTLVFKKYISLRFKMKS